MRIEYFIIITLVIGAIPWALALFPIHEKYNWSGRREISRKILAVMKYATIAQGIAMGIHIILMVLYFIRR